jgi:DNA repair exonuclease SbcCD nuclease subunit
MMPRALWLTILLALLLPALGFVSTGSDLSFVAISDTHIERGSSGYTCYPATHRIVAQITRKLRPDFVLHGGDMLSVNPPARDVNLINGMWRAFLAGVRDPVVHAGIPFFPCPGNHDICGGAREIYRKTWQDFENPGVALHSGSYGAYYSLSWKGTDLIVLDGASLALGEEQKAWLRATFAGLKRTRPVFLVSHMGLTGGRRHPKERLNEEARKVITEGRPDFVLCGHQHEASVTSVDGITQICLGSAGETPPYYYFLFKVRGKEVTWKALTAPPESSDPGAPR